MKHTSTTIAADIADAIRSRPGALRTLLASDLALAYSVDMRTAHAALALLIEQGLLEKHALGIRGDILYRVAPPTSQNLIRIPGAWWRNPANQELN